MQVDTSPFNPQQAMRDNAGALDKICAAQTKTGSYALPVRWSPESDLNVLAVRAAVAAFPHMFHQLQNPNVVNTQLTYYLQLLFLAGY